MILASRSQSIPSDELRRSRQVMILRVRATWIDGVLLKSLYNEARPGVRSCRRSSKGRASVVCSSARGWRTAYRIFLKVLPLSSFDDQLAGSLLILGAPGGGKTTLLLELARELLARAEHDPDHAIPVVLNLSSWSTKRLSLTNWLLEELAIQYDVSSKLAQEWVSHNMLLLLLDGLDEVSREYRDTCVAAINTFRAGHGLHKWLFAAEWRSTPV